VAGSGDWWRRGNNWGGGRGLCEEGEDCGGVEV